MFTDIVLTILSLAVIVAAILIVRRLTRRTPVEDMAEVVTVSGKVVKPDGLPLRNAVITMTDEDGVVESVTISSFGLFRFDDVLTGEEYTVAVQSRSYRYAPLTVYVTADITLPDFVGME